MSDSLKNEQGVLVEDGTPAAKLFQQVIEKNEQHRQALAKYVSGLLDTWGGQDGAVSEWGETRAEMARSLTERLADGRILFSVQPRGAMPDDVLQAKRGVLTFLRNGTSIPMNVVFLNIREDFALGDAGREKAPQVFDALYAFDRGAGDGPDRYTATLLKALPPKDRSLQAFPKL